MKFKLMSVISVAWSEINGDLKNMKFITYNNFLVLRAYSYVQCDSKSNAKREFLNACNATSVGLQNFVTKTI